jgi:hypothetical protein
MEGENKWKNGNGNISQALECHQVQKIWNNPVQAQQELQMSNTDSIEEEISTSCTKPGDTVHIVKRTTNYNYKHMAV